MTPRWSTTTKRAVALVGAGTIGVFLLHVFDVLAPFIWAAVFAYVFGPVVGFFQRRSGAPRGVVVATLFVALGLVVLIAIMTTATTIGLSVLQVPFSYLLGLLTGVLETIPIVGPITAGAIAVLVSLGHPAPLGWTQTTYAAVVAVMYTVFRHVEDYVVIPQVIGRI